MAKFVIPETRKSFLLHNFVEYSFEQDDNVNDLEADKVLFDSITSPEEIFFLAQCCNWDDGAIIPEWIIDSPLCTKAAALTIFWQSAPYEYMEYAFGSKIPQWKSSEEDEEQTKILNILEKLISKFKASEFHQLSIQFDFNVWGGKLIVDSPKWEPPKEFFTCVEGIEVI
jgi:hypothetical protein